MLSTTVRCKTCGKKIVIMADTEGSLHLRASKRKYCDECMKQRMYLSNKASKKKRRNMMEEYVQINFREFDEGYIRFWKKRGMEPPKVDVWGNYCVR